MSGRWRPTPLAFALLGLVHQQPRSGYDLCQLFENTPLATYSGGPGAVYPALRRLERKRLVSGRLETGGGRRRRRVYRPTPAGLVALAGWVAEPVTREQVMRELDLLMLRLAFMPGLVSRAVVRRFLAAIADEATRFTDELRAHRPKVGRPHGSIAPLLALDAGIAQYVALTRWAHRALGRLDEEANR